MTLLHLVSEIRARLDAGMAPRDIARQLGPMLDAEVDLGVLPGTVGILGELLDGLVWSGVVLVLAAAMRRGRRRRRPDPLAPAESVTVHGFTVRWHPGSGETQEHPDEVLVTGADVHIERMSGTDILAIIRKGDHEMRVTFHGPKQAITAWAD